MNIIEKNYEPCKILKLDAKKLFFMKWMIGFITKRNFNNIT